jgi:hypothetical protein
MENNIIKKYLEIKNGLKNPPPKPIAQTKKEKEKVKADEQYLSGSGGTINQIIEKKPKLKYVSEYLQARVDELNQIEMNA